MGDIVVETSLPPEEIEENFRDFDLTAALEQALKDAVAYKNGTPVQSTVQPYHEFGTISTEQIVKDARQILDEFASDYKKMVK